MSLANQLVQGLQPFGIPRLLVRHQVFKKHTTTCSAAAVRIERSVNVAAAASARLRLRISRRSVPPQNPPGRESPFGVALTTRRNCISRRRWGPCIESASAVFSREHFVGDIWWDGYDFTSSNSNGLLVDDEEQFAVNHRRDLLSCVAVRLKPRLRLNFKVCEHRRLEARRPHARPRHIFT